MKKDYLFTSESVSEGHPDKVCDRISDMVVDTYLSMDPVSRVACETLTTTNRVVLAGEIRGPKINNDELSNKVRDCIKDIGYDQEGFSWKNAKIENGHETDKNLTKSDENRAIRIAPSRGTFLEGSRTPKNPKEIKNVLQ